MNSLPCCMRICQVLYRNMHFLLRDYLFISCGALSRSMVKITDCPSNMFWGVTLDGGKKYSQTVEQGFHVSMAALDLNGKTSENVQVMLHHDSSDFLLCTLNKSIPQQCLDLNFETGEEIAFSLNGSGAVHLTGYIVTPEDDYEDQSFDSEDEEVPSLTEMTDESLLDSLPSGIKRKKLAVQSVQKKRKLDMGSMDNDDDDDDDSEDDDYLGSESDDDEVPEEYDSDLDSDDDDDEEDDESEVEEEDDEEEEKEVTVSKKQKTPAKSPQPQKASKTPAKSPQPQSASKKGKNQDAGNTPKQANKKNEQNKQATPPTTPPTENGESAKKKKKKKNRNKNKEAENSLNESNASTQGQSPKTSKTETPKKKVVSGGTIVEDMKVGHGPEAKPGKMVSVYYVGTLAKNNARFDSCQGGKPFRFRLNQGEVIKGWDNGVQGMKVGGKRKITVPASQGYGNMKQGPIPANSTLVFEVELKAVN